MADLFGVVWTRLQGAPCKVADMVLTDREHRIRLTGDAPYSLIASKAGLQQITYPSREGAWFEPHIQALLPQPATLHHSLIQARAMAQAGATWRSASPREQAWLMLLATGHSNTGFSIGHLGVFASDDHAVIAWSNDLPGEIDSQTIARPAHALLDLVADYIASPNAAPALLAPLGNVASVGGMMPKILACIAVDSAQQWDGVLFAPNAVHLVPPPGKHWMSVLVKFEPKGSAGLLALENACYDVHRQAGLTCPATWLGEVVLNGRTLTALCSERFDRSALPAGLPQPFASFAAVLHSGNPSKYLHRTDARMDDLPQLLRAVSSQPAQDAQALYLRYLLALLTGNGDAHLDNWGMLGTYPNAVLSPVYDPAPMRAFGYNCVSALPLGAADHDWTAGYLPSHLAQRLGDWAKALGLRADTAKKLTQRAFAALDSYPAQVQALWHSQNPEPCEVFLHRIAQVRAQIAQS
jgi:serine/threonine-protein kinase HipA